MDNNQKQERVLIKRTIKDIAVETSKSFNGINAPEIKMIIEESFDVIKKMLLNDDYILIKGFGVFFTDYLNETDIKDPRNNDIIHCKKRRTPRFSFSRKFKKQIKKFDK